jgi:hypothetical protein
MSAHFATFYSYTGGVGRTLALANVAWVLAQSGRRVLAIDWCLESPGLQPCFRPFLSDGHGSATEGVIDFLLDYCEQAAQSGEAYEADLLPYAVALDWDHFPDGGALHYVSAGKRSGAYSVRVQSFDWQSFYDRLSGIAAIRSMRQRLSEEYDFVLIDCPHGISSSAAVCLTELADIVVCGFTMSDHAIQGSAALLDFAYRFRDQARPRLLPVPMMVDPGEKDLLDRRRQMARTVFDPLLELRVEERQKYWETIEFPYIPYYRFGSRLAAFSGESFTTMSMLASATRLASYIAGEEIRIEPVAKDRAAHVQARMEDPAIS